MALIFTSPIEYDYEFKVLFTQRVNHLGNLIHPLFHCVMEILQLLTES